MNPAQCLAELVLPEGRACCELPGGHIGPHRASGPPHSLVPGRIVAWEIETPLRCVVTLAEATTHAA